MNDDDRCFYCLASRAEDCGKCGYFMDHDGPKPQISAKEGLKFALAILATTVLIIAIVFLLS